VNVCGDAEDGLKELDAVTDFRGDEVGEFVVAALGGWDGALEGGGRAEWVRQAVPGERWSGSDELGVWCLVLAVADDFREFGEGVPCGVHVSDHVGELGEFFGFCFGAVVALVDIVDGVGDLCGSCAGDADEVWKGDFESGVVVGLEVDDRCVSKVSFDGSGAAVVDKCLAAAEPGVERSFAGDGDPGDVFEEDLIGADVFAGMRAENDVMAGAGVR